MDDTYEAGAKYYDDVYGMKEALADRDFYVELAREHGGPVLELGCGTGRIALPIARSGIDITAVDVSAAMLQVLQNKLSDEPDSVRQRVKAVTGDMRRLHLERQFSLVTIPFRPMQHMYTTADQLAALMSAGRHLADRGILAFDVFNPSFEKILSGVGNEYLETEWLASDGSDRTFRRFFVKDALDMVHLNLSGRFIYRLYDGERVVTEEVHPLRMSFYTYPHLELLFAAAGLEIVSEFGSFDRRPLGPDAPEMIFLLKRCA